jgi:hypothetical protein
MKHRIQAYRNKVTNDHKTPVTLWIEPWGEDYTLLPNETVDLVAEAYSEEFYLHWVVSEGKILIYAEGDQAASVSVHQAGNRLQCGHHGGNPGTAIEMGSGSDQTAAGETEA